MRLLYISSIQMDNKSFLGVGKKINSQIEAFRNNGIEAEHYNFPPVNNNVLAKINRRINLLSCNSYITLKNNIDFSKYDILYVRYTLSDYVFIKFLKNAKESNPKLKILVEIPTYPYDGEYKIIRKYPIAIKDKIYRKELQRYVDKIVTFSDDEEIFNIDTININNGIDIKSLKLSKVKSNDRDLNILAVANVCFWHGYDRLIKSIGKFYEDKTESRHINFYIVGSGGEIGNLKNLVKDLKLEKHVHFEGPKAGEELDSYFDFCHVGVDHLGLHRKNMTKLSSLKSKEYCGRALPFILAHKDLAFDNFPYVLEFEATEENIDMNELFQFKNRIYADELYNEYMRKYSLKFDWNTIINELIEKI